MSNNKAFKIFITNQSNKERIIRASIGIALILMCFIVDRSMSSFISISGLMIAGALFFNAISGNCYIYRLLGYSTCPISESEN